jgi:hypothetical protein
VREQGSHARRSTDSCEVPGRRPVAASPRSHRPNHASASDVNNRGVEKHLLMLGPSALAVLAGAAANASGPAKVPFWNGRVYLDPLVAGT